MSELLTTFALGSVAVVNTVKILSTALAIGLMVYGSSKLRQHLEDKGKVSV